MRDKILELAERGLSYRGIQAELGCSKGTIAYHLGAGQKEKSVARVRDKRGRIQKRIQEYKIGKSCTDCKEDYPYWVLEFDHLRDKSFNISEAAKLLVTMEALEAEIAKCDIVCANCHRTRTYRRLLKSNSNTP